MWARAFKDLYPRFHTMRGRYVARKGGWDCHGLPVEVEVEKALGIKNKHEIEDFGIEAFNQRCRESVQRYVEDWSALTARIGMWIDTADAYWTLNNEYIESVWWLVRQMWDRDLLYEGFKVVPYCGRCGTALSSHELGQPGAYQDVTEPSVYVRFPVIGADFDLLVWTTTPWTLVSNVAAAVGPEIEYVRVKAPDGGRDLVLAATRVADVLGDDVEVVEAVPVSDLAGLRYERPFDYLPIDPGANRVVVADFVTIEEGSGIVHLAPAFGEVDREVAEQEQLPVLNPVGPDARFDASVPQLAGQFVKDADPALIDALTAAGRIVSIVDYAHSYPALLAVRDTAHLLGQADVVRAHVRAQGRAAPRERDDRLAPRATSSTADSATGSRTTSTGRCLAIASGARRCPSGDAATARPTRAWARSPSSASSQGGTSPISTCTGRTSTTSRSRAPSARGARIASSRCSTRGSTPGPCRRRSSTIRSRTRHSSNVASPPISSPRRSTRRAAGSTRCSPSTRSCSTGLRIATSCASR